VLMIPGTVAVSYDLPGAAPKSIPTAKPRQRKARTKKTQAAKKRKSAVPAKKATRKTATAKRKKPIKKKR
jgi:hypothetical protein